MEDPQQQPFSFSTPLTHHGEETGCFQGEIFLHAPCGKQREKLYDFVKIEKDEAVVQKHQIKSQSSQQWEHSFNMDQNVPNQVLANQVKQSPPGTPAAFKVTEQRAKPGSPVLGRGDTPVTPPARNPTSIQRFGPCPSARGPPSTRQQESFCPPASADKPEMVDNPLYGPVNTGSNLPPSQNRPHKPPEPAPRKTPAVRQRSMTYSSSERKPAVLEKAAVKNVLSALASNSVTRPEIVAPKPRPPLPAKSHALRDAQNN